MRNLILLFLALAFAASMAAVEPYVPTDAERARWTMSDLANWRACFEAYKNDYGRYPTGTLADIHDALVPLYADQLPMDDAWGRPWRVQSDGTSYRIVSAGSDGEFDGKTWSEAARELAYDADAVAASGSRWLTRAWRQR